jgi:membrane associated rhomboid family serine protease
MTAPARLRDGREYRLRRGGRGARPPRYWLALAGRLSPEAPVPERRLNAWLLVLEARNIPHVLFPNGDCPGLYIPSLYEGIAVREILDFESERSVPFAAPPASENAPGVALFLSLLALWHALRWNWLSLRLPSPPFPPTAHDWTALFALDAYRTRVLHEWWRSLTALTLHADGPHLAGNLIFGLFFCIPLCRRAGLGLGIFLTIAAGALGNALNAVSREAASLSLGFSTALFGALGSLCAFAAADALRPRFLPPTLPGASRSGGPDAVFSLPRRLGIPLAAGLALLGMTGGGEEARVDYAAHIWGFCCGLACAAAALPCERALRRLGAAKGAAAQGILFLASLAAVAGAWRYALLAR